jgi:hypothetical protein
MKMEPNKLENEFKDKLEQRAIQPSEMAWDRLDAMLSVTENKKPKKNRAWMYMAAALLIFLLVGALFLNQEKQANGMENNNTVVTTKEELPQQSNSETIKAETIVTPQTTQEAIAVQSQSSPVQIKKTTLPVQKATQGTDKVNEVAVANNEVTASKEKEVQNVIQQPTDNQLLASAMATTDAPKKKSTVKVDPNSLLSSVEGELNENYRSKAFQGVVKSFNTVKVAVANRNYE